MNCFMQNTAMLPVEKGKGLAENKRFLNLSKYLGGEIITLFKVNGIRQNIAAGFHFAIWEHEHGS